MPEVLSATFHLAIGSHWQQSHGDEREFRATKGRKSYIRSMCNGVYHRARPGHPITKYNNGHETDKLCEIITDNQVSHIADLMTPSFAAFRRW